MPRLAARGALRGTVGDGLFPRHRCAGGFRSRATGDSARAAPAGAVPRPRRGGQRRPWLGRHARSLRVEPGCARGDPRGDRGGLACVRRHQPVGRGARALRRGGGGGAARVDGGRGATRRRHDRRHPLLPVPRGCRRARLSPRQRLAQARARHAAGSDARMGTGPGAVRDDRRPAERHGGGGSGRDRGAAIRGWRSGGVGAGHSGFRGSARRHRSDRHARGLSRPSPCGRGLARQVLRTK